MSRRLTVDVTRPAPIEIVVDGVPVTAYEGESLATVLLAAERFVFSRDASGRARSPFCNMGVCFDCMIFIESEETPRRVRACLTPARAGMKIRLAAEPVS